jgi:hypothetical protein
MEVSGQLHAPATLLQGKEPQYPLNRRLCGPQSLSGIFEKEKTLFLVLRIEPWLIQSIG